MQLVPIICVTFFLLDSTKQYTHILRYIDCFTTYLLESVMAEMPFFSYVSKLKRMVF